MAVSDKARTRAGKGAAPAAANGNDAAEATPEALGLSDERLVEFYRKMVLIRRFEEKCAEAYAYGKIGGFCHLYIGQEAVAVGSIAALRDDDHLVTHYRDHGYALARGCDPGATMAELYGRATGLSGGRGGSMHLADVEKHFWGGYAIVAGHLPLAVGIAQAIKYRGEDQVVVAYFGDGSTNNGTFHEAVNMAAVWDLPVIFLAENNQYGMGTAIGTASRVTELVEKAVAHQVPAEQVDGMDVLAMYEATARLAARCRAGEGPFFLEAKTYRLVGHSVADPAGYRTKDEVDRYRTGEPIARLGKLLEERGALSADDAERLDREVLAEVEEIARFADESPEPAPDTLYDHVYANPLGAK
jgi:pyruvate dehydrogenase E1 component alpha subunit